MLLALVAAVMVTAATTVQSTVLRSLHAVAHYPSNIMNVAIATWFLEVTPALCNHQTVAPAVPLQSPLLVTGASHAKTFADLEK